MTRVYVLNTHRWLHEQLCAGVDSKTIEWAPTPDAADLIIVPVPEWPDHEAPEPLRLSVIRRYWTRLYLYSTNDLPLLWAPGAYASAPKAWEHYGVRGGCYVVHHHHEQGGMFDKLEAVPAVARQDLLWSFIGTVENHVRVRGAIVALDDPRAFTADTVAWHRELRWAWQSQAGSGFDPFSSYIDVATRSKFIVCPRGVGPASMRLYEAMQMRRCPVIVADSWLPPAFVDWSSCSIQVPERDIQRIPTILREREQDAHELGLQARAVWEQHFARPAVLPAIVAACLDIRDRGGMNARRRFKLAARSLATHAFARRARQRLRLPALKRALPDSAR